MEDLKKVNLKCSTLQYRATPLACWQVWTDVWSLLTQALLPLVNSRKLFNQHLEKIIEYRYDLNILKIWTQTSLSLKIYSVCAKFDLSHLLCLWQILFMSKWLICRSLNLNVTKRFKEDELKKSFWLASLLNDQDGR